MGSRTNRYRSGAKNPHQEVLVTKLDNGQYAVSVFDAANLRIAHFKSPRADVEPEALGRLGNKETAKGKE